MLSDSLSEDLYSKLYSLDIVAGQYYNLSEVIDAAEVYKRALDIAETLNDSDRATRYRRWCGACNYEGGRLLAGLNILAPVVVSVPIQESRKQDFYVAMIKYVEIAQEIPLSLKSITAGHANITNFLRDNGLTDWQHMLNRKLSELLKLRGLFDQALGLAQESWHHFKATRGNGPSFLAEEYLYNLVDLCLKLHNLDQAEYCIGLWRYEGTSVPSYKEMTLLIRESQLMRIKNQIYESIELARKAVSITKQANHYWRIGCATKALIRSFLLAENFEMASKELLNMSAFRHCESFHNRYDFHLLRGDLYNSYFRFLGGLPMIDFEYESSNQADVCVNEILKWTLKRGAKEIAEKYKRLSLKAYKVAQSIGIIIDDLLESDYRVLQTSHRIHQLLLYQIHNNS